MGKDISIVDVNRKKEITDLLQTIQRNGLASNSYSSDKQAISQLFCQTSENTEANILLRLTVIDKMIKLYSTPPKFQKKLFHHYFSLSHS